MSLSLSLTRFAGNDSKIVNFGRLNSLMAHSLTLNYLALENQPRVVIACVGT